MKLTIYNLFKLLNQLTSHYLTLHLYLIIGNSTITTMDELATILDSKE